MVCRLISKGLCQFRPRCKWSVFVIIAANFLILHLMLVGIADDNLEDSGAIQNRNANHKNINHRDLGRVSSSNRKLMQKISLSSKLPGHHNKYYSYGNHSLDVSMLSCRDLANITDWKYVTSGWTKAVYRGRFKGKEVAVKTVDLNGHDMKKCSSEGTPLAECYWKASQKIVNEIQILRALADDTVIKVHGSCVPGAEGSNRGTFLVTELGQEVNFIKLLQMSWEDRLRICHDLTKILHIMSYNRLGKMAMNDFRRQQFVLVDGRLKLSDVDDASFGDPPCQSRRHCTLRFSNPNFTKTLRCVYGKCEGYNEQRNIFNSARHFTTYLLPYGAPPSLKPRVNRVVSGFANVTMDTSELMRRMEEILNLFISGKYLKRFPNEVTRYKRLEGLDVLPVQDYRCQLSPVSAACITSVFDEQEAESLCDADDRCKGFVLTPDRTWTGRKVIYLKNGIAQTRQNNKTSVFVKP